MARQEVNIGVEGNDGTGDSIRASFKKVNENFVELYAVFGLGGRINFTTLNDTPDALIPQTIPIVNNAGTEIMLAEIDSDTDNSIVIEVTDGVGTNPGKIKFVSTFGAVIDDVTPRLGGPLYAANNIIAGVSTTQDDLDYLNAVHDTNLTMDSVVLTQGVADQRYLTTEVPITVDKEPEGTNHYTWKIFDYISTPGEYESSVYIISHLTEEQEESVTGHGLTSAWNGTPVRLQFLNNIPTPFSDYLTAQYYIRVISDEHLWLYSEANKEYSYTTNQDDAILYKMDLTTIGDIAIDDVHQMVLAAYDDTLTGNYLANQMVPRKDLVFRHGDTMTGPLYMPDHPGDLRGVGAPNGVEDLQVATKLYVDRGSAWTSADSLYVSTTGNDRMEGVPLGKEGSSISFAFSSIRAAAAHAEAMVKASRMVPGPFVQSLTYTTGGNAEDTYVLDYRVKGGTENQAYNENVRLLMSLNTKYLINETYAYINNEYPDYIRDKEQFLIDMQEIVDAIRVDMSLGSTANFLSIQAAQVYFSELRKRKEVYFNITELLASLEFMKGLTRQCLLQDFLHEGRIETIVVGTSTILTLELPNTNYVEGAQIRFRGIPAGDSLEFLNDNTYYVRPVDTYLRSFELFTDSTLDQPLDTSAYTDLTNALSADYYTGIIWQNEELQILDDTIDQTDLASRVDNVEGLYEDIASILENGIDATPERISYGQPYQIFCKNGGAGFIDQTNLNSIEASAGKLIIGKRSRAIARIIRFQNDNVSDPQTDPLDPAYTELNPTMFDLHLMTPKNFELGEPLELAQAVKERSISIQVEAGTYYEDFPIRLSDNVSLTGENISKVIIKPKLEEDSNRARVSQSQYTQLYLFRDTEFDGMTISSPGVLDYTNQVGDVVGSLGYHYLIDPSKVIDVGPAITNAGGYINAATILDANIEFIAVETVARMIQAHPTDVVDEDLLAKEMRRAFNAFSYDLRYGGEIRTLEAQGYYYNNSTVTYADSTRLQEALTIGAGLIQSLWNGTIPTPVNSYKKAVEIRNNSYILLLGETDAHTTITSLITKVMYVYDANYNPPKRNDELDCFLLNDAASVSGLTCVDHGGFMFAFDPEGQISTTSPNVHTLQTISRTKNEKTFTGGMYLDAYVANKPMIITSALTNLEDLAPNQLDPSSHVAGSLTLTVTSPADQGLFLQPPILPAPFYIEGRHYQVNAYSDYDRALGTCTLYLEPTSNDGYGYVASQFSDYVPGETARPMFLQTAGSRSLSATSVTYYNDLGYGVVATNGSLVDQKTVSTYYCYAGLFANAGSEIRSQSSANTYGLFGIVAEGADHNEIPDQVESKYAQILPCVTDSTLPAYNLEGENAIFARGFAHAPHSKSRIIVNHGGATNADGDPFGRLNYEVNAVALETAGATQLDNIYRLTITPNETADNDFYGTVQATIPDGTVCEYRDNKQFTFTGIRSQEKLDPRPSTAINYDESDTTTYRTLAFAFEDPYGTALAVDEARITVEQEFQFVELRPDHTETGGGYGSSLSDSRLAIAPLVDAGTFSDAARAVGKVFAWQGRLHRITEYSQVYEIETDSTTPFSVGQALTSSSGGAAENAKNTTSYTKWLYNVSGTFEVGDTVGGQTITTAISQSSWALIKFELVTGSDILGDNNAGLRLPIPSDLTILYAGNEAQATAEITINISICRAIGHDFKEIGYGSLNDSNYPNAIFGDSKNSLASYYDASPTASSAEVWEKRKGRCFWVSTDQYGFFRVGQYFNVDQGTGAISFSGNVGISNASSLGFVQGVTINEFSVDDSFLDMSSTAVPTEKAIGTYISKVLGYDFTTGSIFGPAAGRIGPGFLPLDGHLSNASMTGNLMMGGNKISDLDNPQNGDDAATKAYVDDNSALYNENAKMRDFAAASRTEDLGANQLLVSTGNRIIYVNTPSSGSFTPGAAIRNTADPALATITGTVIQSEPYVDELFGNVIKVVYTPGATLGGRSFDSNLDAVVYGGTYTSGTAQIQSTFITAVGDDTAVGGSFPEITNASEASGSDIQITVSRSEDVAEINLQIAPLTITNADVSATAGIVQSKLLMEHAKTGVNTITNPPQSDLGLAQFNEDEFQSLYGFIKLKPAANSSTGVTLDKIQHIQPSHVLGRTGTTGEVTQIPFSTIAGSTGGIVREDFPQRYVSGQDVLIRVGGASGDAASDTFDTVQLSTVTTNDTVVRRTSDGDIEGRRLIIDDYVQFRDSANIIRDLFSSQGEGEINVGDVLGSNGSVLSAGSSVQLGSTGYTSKFVASNWGYFKGVEAPDRGGNNGAGVGMVFGAGTGFADSTNTNIVMYSAGLPALKFDSAGIFIAGTGSRNIGTSASKFNTVYASVFNGTATKAQYADLAENYQADAVYEAGTVLVFGGTREVTQSLNRDDARVAGVVSTNPAHLMNAELEGPNVVALALQGRVPCKVIGQIKKGDMIVSSYVPGHGIASINPQIGTVLGKALQAKDTEGEGMIEIVVGRL